MRPISPIITPFLITILMVSLSKGIPLADSQHVQRRDPSKVTDTSLVAGQSFLAFQCDPKQQGKAPISQLHSVEVVCAAVMHARQAMLHGYSRMDINGTKCYQKYPKILSSPRILARNNIGVCKPSEHDFIAQFPLKRDEWAFGTANTAQIVLGFLQSDVQEKSKYEKKEWWRWVQMEKKVQKKIPGLVLCGINIKETMTPLVELQGTFTHEDQGLLITKVTDNDPRWKDLNEVVNACASAADSKGDITKDTIPPPFRLPTLPSSRLTV